MNRHRNLTSLDDDREPRDSRMTRRDGHLFDPMHQWSQERRDAYRHAQEYQEETDRRNLAFGVGQTVADRFDERTS